MAGIAQNGQKRLIFTAVPQVRTKMREKGKRENNNNNNMRMNKSKENALIYIHMYIYTHTNGHTNIYKYRDTYSHKRIMCYSNQAVLFDIMFESF